MPPEPGPGRHTIRFGTRQLPVPQSRAGRVVLGYGLIVVWVVGFALPLIGVWMVAPGLLILSKDSHRVRRFRRKSEVWGLRKYRAFKARRAGAPLPGLEAAAPQPEPTWRAAK